MAALNKESSKACDVWDTDSMSRLMLHQEEMYKKIQANKAAVKALREKRLDLEARTRQDEQNTLECQMAAYKEWSKRAMSGTWTP